MYQRNNEQVSVAQESWTGQNDVCMYGEQSKVEDILGSYK